jgi:hypothetical protein
MGTGKMGTDLFNWKFCAVNDWKINLSPFPLLFRFSTTLRFAHAAQLDRYAGNGYRMK